MTKRRVLSIILPLLATLSYAGTPIYSAEPSKTVESRKTPDYSKRAQVLDASIQAKLIGRWTNPADKLIIEITSVDLASGELKGTVQPTSGPAAAEGHELIGWVSAAPIREGLDNVIPVSFSTTLYEYGTLPVWGGYLKDGQILTMHYLIWPNQTYSWNHISTFTEIWSRMP